MTDFFFRTEDIKSEEILDYFVDTDEDRSIVESLKNRNPVVLIGSRGVGKSFLLRVAEVELQRELAQSRALPVYVTFTRGTLVHTSDPLQFHHWMLARLCTRIIRTMKNLGRLRSGMRELSILAGAEVGANAVESTPIEEVSRAFEESWRSPGQAVDTSRLPSVDDFKDAIEDLCEGLDLDRVVIFFDEAAHIFRPEQQRQFFTLFRDLRSPRITCNAAVYPGVTAYGDTFQPVHDATMIQLDRSIHTSSYLSDMREIVEKQATSQQMEQITRQGQNFATLAYAANGNPRLLLKTLARVPKLGTREVNDLIREYYRNDVWTEHSSLVGKYGGHRALIDWGRVFIENSVLPETHIKNANSLVSHAKHSCYFWIHRDAPETVREALRILSYTGIVSEQATGIKGSRSEIGTRYSVNFGCLLAQDSQPASVAVNWVKNLSLKRMTEFGQSHPAFAALVAAVPTFSEPDASEALNRQLSKDIDVLDITDWQRGKLRELGLHTLREVLNATETKLQEAYYVGQKRSRRMRNAAIAAVYEYLSG